MDILIVGDIGVISTGITALLAARGDHVAIVSRGQTTTDLPPGVARWFNPRTGDTYRAPAATDDAVHPEDRVLLATSDE